MTSESCEDFYGEDEKVSGEGESAKITEGGCEDLPQKQSWLDGVHKSELRIVLSKSK